MPVAAVRRKSCNVQSLVEQTALRAVCPWSSQNRLSRACREPGTHKGCQHGGAKRRSVPTRYRKRHAMGAVVLRSGARNGPELLLAIDLRPLHPHDLTPTLSGEYEKLNNRPNGQATFPAPANTSANSVSQSTRSRADWRPGALRVRHGLRNKLSFHTPVEELTDGCKGMARS